MGALGHQPGRVGALDVTPTEGVSVLQRRVLALVELRAAFRISRSELDAADRGADDADLEPLDRAAHQIAHAENGAVFHGLNAAITGVSEATPHEQASLGEPSDYPKSIAGAIEKLLSSGIAGPYGVALGSLEYQLALGNSERGGYPVREHLEKVLGGPVVWAPGVTGALVVSLRGGDFVFESGQDLSIGYASHDEESVALYLEESFSFHVATPEAAVALLP